MTTAALPPRGFVPAGEVRHAERSARGPAFRRTTAPAVQARLERGLRYERQVGDALQEWCEARAFALDRGLWFRFVSAGAQRWCQPDLVVDPGPECPLLILEVKLQFEARAWWQLEHLYRPVVSRALGRECRIGVICASYDPAIALPVDCILQVDSPAQWLSQSGLRALLWGAFALPVLQWKRPSAKDIIT